MRILNHDHSSRQTSRNSLTIMSAIVEVLGTRLSNLGQEDIEFLAV